MPPISPERWRTLSPYLDEALEIEAAEQNAWLASISARRLMEPERLTRLVRGELDWIVMRSLEKDRNRRYGTAGDLAADVPPDHVLMVVESEKLIEYRCVVARGGRAGGDDDARTHVPHDVGELAATVDRYDRDRYGADAPGRELEDHDLEAVGQVHQHLVEGPDTLVDHRGSRRVDPVTELLKTQPLVAQVGEDVPGPSLRGLRGQPTDDVRHQASMGAKR